MKCLVQIGCNTGDEYIFNTIYEYKINKCIFVDANEMALKICHENFMKFLSSKDQNFDVDLHYVPAIISNHSDQYVDFNIPENNILSGHSSIYPSQLVDQTYKTKKVLNITIENLLNFFKITTIDYFVVDAEGCDKEILLSLNWDKYKIENIKFEFTHWDGYKKHISNNLNDFIFSLLMRGYAVKKTSPTDITASL